MHKKRVLVLHPPLYPVNYKFYNFLGKHVDLTVFQYGDYPNNHPSWSYENLKHLNSNFTLQKIGSGKESFSNQFNIYQFKQFLRVKPDVIISIAFWLPSLVFSILKYIYKYKFCILTNATIISEKTRSKGLRVYYRKTLSFFTDVFISASPHTTKYLLSLRKQSKITLSIQGIGLKDWRNVFDKLSSKKDLRRELNLPNNKKILLGVGNLTEIKNWLSVIKYFKDCEGDYVFALVGYGECLIEYKDFIKKNNLDQKVLLLGKKSGTVLQKIYKSADFFIFPTFSDTFGFVVPEALASNLPVFCSKYAGASFLICKDNGRVFDPKDSFDNQLNNFLLDYAKGYNTFDSIKHLTIKRRSSEFLSVINSV